MLDYPELLKIISSLPTKPNQGTAFRAIKLKHFHDNYILQPKQFLSAIGSRKAGGRYNPPLVFEALYLADTDDNAFKEANKSKLDKPPSRVILTIDYKLNACLDLVDTNTQNFIATNLNELKAGWLDINIKNHQITATQKFGLVVYLLGDIEVIKVPLAITDNAYNIVIFPDRLSRDSYAQVYDETGIMKVRIP